MSEWTGVLSMLEDRTGLAFAGHLRTRMVEAVITGARANRCPDEARYAALLERDPEALSTLVSSLVVHESYFFRHPAQMALLRAVILPDLAAARGSVALWSAGCAAGEEAYTLAIVAHTAGLGHRVSVLGTDLSATAIERARAARYGQWARRGMTDAETQLWFQPAGDAHVVRPDVRERVQLRVHNLLDGPPGRFDVVLCRNVLMYLSPTAIERVSAVLTRALRSGGWLLTSAADPPLVADGLERVGTAHGSAYRLRPIPARATTAASPAGPAGRRTRAGRGRPAASRGAASPASAPVDAADRALRLMDQGRHDDAMGVLEQAVADEPMRADLRHFMAVLHLEAHRPEDAAREARAALYLEPGRAVTHLILGHAALALGRPDAAARSYGRASRDLGTRPPDEIIAGTGGQTAAHLRAVAERLMQQGTPTSAG